MYKWVLRKGSKKEVCPQCGQRRFVPYVSAVDGSLAGEAFGRCDREQNCGYIRYPSSDTHAPVGDIPAKPVLPALEFAPAAIRTKKSALYDYAVNLITEQGALKAWNDYKIGATLDGRTIFWQIDKNGVIRAGKAIKYKPDGHRDKNIFPAVNWAHKMREFDGLHTGEELQQCYFGEYLLNGNEKPVIIVESEKTAALMSAFFPAYIWLASGGSQGLKRLSTRNVLDGRKVKLLPDNGQYFNWRTIALAKGWQILDYMEQHTPFEGADILDILDYENNGTK